MGAGLGLFGRNRSGVRLCLARLRGRANSAARNWRGFAQRAENDFVGARCGIMDQFTSAHGRAGKAIMLDCRSLEYDLVAHPGIGAPRDLQYDGQARALFRANTTSAAPNARQRFAKAGRVLSRNIRALRDVTLDQIEQHRADMPDVVYRRALHVVAENERVLDAVKALRSGDLAAFGTADGGIARQPSRFVRSQFARAGSAWWSWPQGEPGVYGARMTGGGFGGCTINLVEAAQADAFRARIEVRYEELFKIRPDIQICQPVEGAARVA